MEKDGFDIIKLQGILLSEVLPNSLGKFDYFQHLSA